MMLFIILVSEIDDLHIQILSWIEENQACTVWCLFDKKKFEKIQDNMMMQGRKCMLDNTLVFFKHKII